MSATFDNRAELRRGLLRLLAMSTSDGSLAEHEATGGDTLNHFIQHGVWEAQSYLLSHVDPDRWRKRSSAITWSGADSTDGGRYVELASDFLRLYGNRERSALVEADGKRWGRQLDTPLDRYEVRGDYYWVDRTSNADRLWIAKAASPPTTLYYEYNYRHPTFSDDSTAAEFPSQHTPLIVAFAADYAAHHPFFPGGDELRGAIARNLAYWKASVYVGARRTREPRKVKSGNVIGTRWWTGAN
jgi:hypothetical protein